MAPTWTTQHPLAMASPKLQRGRNSRLGAYYAVTMALDRRATLFADPALARVAGAEICNSPAETCAWVVMPDHVHWLLCLRSASLSRCVQAFKSRSARAMNAARGTTGKIWQAGYYDHQLRSDEDLRQQARYIVANPLRRGLVAPIEDFPHWRCGWVSGSDDLIG